ncbi:hypothetical protein [Tenacibaculum maritimum]|uniref:hypothetical protein n=1 Tax=Tenacibaculum maritimum TaxID=107401 RepID=UPI001330AF59|nr:hypothetical protein [Tenacibaculum maritimum]
MRTKVNLRNKVEIFPYQKKVVTSKKLLKLLEKNSEKVENVNFVTPKLGSNSLGKFVVEYEW